MLKHEKNSMARVNQSLIALISGDLSSTQIPKETGEFEETFSLLTQVTSSLKNIAAQANQISVGNYLADIAPRSDKDELGLAMQKMTATLRDIAKVSEVIGSGAILDAKVEIKGKDDLLGHSMNGMIEMLKDVARQVSILAQGDYLADIQPRSNHDVIGSAMQAMTLTLRQASKVVEQVALGDLDMAIEIKGEKDLLANAVNTMIASLKNIAAQANQISVGNYLADIAPRSDKDELGLAMQKMTATLRDIAKVAEVIGSGAILDAKVEIKGKDDLLGHSMNGMIEMLKDVARQVSILAQGDYLADIQPRSNQDVIGSAMQAMTLTLRQASNVVEQVALGDLDMAIEIKGENDLLANAVNTMIASLKNIAAQANQISVGNYLADISPRSDKDELGLAMQNMTATLRDIAKVAEVIGSGAILDAKVEIKGKDDLLGHSMNGMIEMLKDLNDKNQKQDWLKTGQNDLNQKLLGTQDETTLSRNIITYLAKYLGAQIGALYLLEEESNDLKLAGSYAFSKRKNLNERIQIGEGLVGQAAYEQELISVTNIPDNYTRIGSATGDAVPRNVVVCPFMHDGQLCGVIELGSFKEFSDTELELLVSTRVTLSTIFNTAKAAAKMKELFEASQNQAEILESQSEELRVSNEELEEQSADLAAQTEKLRFANDGLEVQKSEINKKNDELEKKTEELAISSKYKSEFLANMSHELRTPLNSMLLLSASLAKNTEDNLTPKQVQSATIVHQCGQDLLILINEVLDLSKIEAGKRDIEISPVAIADIIESLQRNFSHMMEEKGLEFIIKTDPSLPVAIYSDRNCLESILKNIMSNAIKFTEAGSITVNFSRPSSDEHLFKSSLEHSNTMLIAFTDTGIGIHADKQSMVFEAFQQAEGGTARTFGGTGLGLSISNDLAELLGGEIQLQSKIGKGSTFTLYIPITKQSRGHLSEMPRDKRAVAGSYKKSRQEVKDEVKDVKAAAEIKQIQTFLAPLDYQVDDDRELMLELGSRSDGKKIMLVIEDDANFAQILINQGREHDLLCVATSTGEEGLMLAEQYLPDVIILDIHLPGIDGRSVLSALKENQQTRHIPVHFMSVDDKNKGHQNLGAIGFISKPVTQEQLDGALNKLVNLTSKAVKDLLIIEDDEPSQIAIQRLIESGDVNITAALTGKEGLKALTSENFDCVILDLKLPDMSGFELLEKLALEKNLQIPPIIIYTGKVLSKAEHKKLLQYSDSIIIKGCDSDDRLLDETALFLHQSIGKLPPEKQKIIHDLYDIEMVFKGKRILLVDDDVRNIFAVSAILEEKGIEVLAAEDGKVALDILKNSPLVDVVLMDIMMPGIDGCETIRQIRTQARFKKLPIIALTAKAMKEDRDKCIAAGASDYLCKPVDAQRLFSMLRIWMYK